jgi:hypothetical protein
MTSWILVSNSGNLIKNNNYDQDGNTKCLASKAMASAKKMSATITTVVAVTVADIKEIMDVEFRDDAA